MEYKNRQIVCNAKSDWKKMAILESTVSKEGNRPARNEFSIDQKGNRNVSNNGFNLQSAVEENFRMVFLFKLYFS